MSTFVYIESALRNVFRSELVTSLVLLVTVVFSAYLAPPIPGSIINLMSFPLVKFIVFVLFLFALKTSFMNSLIISLLFIIVDMILVYYGKNVDSFIDTAVADVNLAEQKTIGFVKDAADDTARWTTNAVDKTVDWTKEAANDTVNFLDGSDTRGY